MKGVIVYKGKYGATKQYADRLILRLGASAEKDPVKKNRMLHDMDNVKKENIADLVNSIRSFNLIHEDNHEFKY
jgi:hypothetical protein